MTSKSRIPNSIMAFASYIVLITNYLLQGDPDLNWKRLGLLDEEMTWLQNFLASWQKVYALYADKNGGRTNEVIVTLNVMIGTMMEYNQKQHLLDRIASSLNATPTDLIKFNIHTGAVQKSPSKAQRTTIQSAMLPTFEPLRGGMLNIKCYSTESSRPGIPEEANCIQYAYSIGTVAPASPDAPNMVHGVSSRASFTLNFGPENSGKQLFIYLRWFNTVHTDQAGSWSSGDGVWLS